MKLTSQVFFSSPSLGIAPGDHGGVLESETLPDFWIDFQLQMFSMLSLDNMLSRAALWVWSVLGRGSSRKGHCCVYVPTPPLHPQFLCLLFISAYVSLCQFKIVSRLHWGCDSVLDHLPDTQSPGFSLLFKSILCKEAS